MKKWREHPCLLIRRFFLLSLTGCACAVIGWISYLTAADRILLGLGIAVCICSIWKSALLWKLIKGKGYEAVAGICVGISAPPFRKYKKIKIIGENGIEGVLLLHRQAHIRIGYCYCFFFKKGSHISFGNGYLATVLATDMFLGYEELGEYMEAERNSIHSHLTNNI